jgi:hypothetical protein
MRPLHPQNLFSLISRPTNVPTRKRSLARFVAMRCAYTKSSDRPYGRRLGPCSCLLDPFFSEAQGKSACASMTGCQEAALCLDQTVYSISELALISLLAKKIITIYSDYPSFAFCLTHLFPGD